MKSYSPLQSGDEIRVVAPSQSMRVNSRRQYDRAKKRLESLGYKITFGKSINNVLNFGTASATDRANDINDAYQDKNVKAILAMQGGWLVNETLPLIDWKLVQNNPKPLIGFSDITVLVNAIYAKTGNIGYLGPTYHIIGAMAEWQYTLGNLNNMLIQKPNTNLVKSRFWRIWSDKKSHKTKKWQVLQSGEAEGVLIGGNLGSFYLLQGTEYQPSFQSKFILAIEDDDETGEYTAREFSRRFESLLQLPNVRKNLQGIIIGRFQPGGKVSENDITNIVASKRLGDIPVIFGVDFGHTLPMVTLPIGGKVKISANNEVVITIVN
jgi:muramoyltetrapeptide carboxypeptidase